MPMTAARSKKILVRILTIVTAGFMAVSGVMKFVGIFIVEMPELLANLEKWGYSIAFILFIGANEIIGAIGLLILPTRTLAIIGLLIIMGGAFYTHVVNYEYLELIPSLIVISLLTGVYFAHRKWHIK